MALAQDQTASEVVKRWVRRLLEQGETATGGTAEKGPPGK
jgi:hypothetical protein